MQIQKEIKRNKLELTYEEYMQRGCTLENLVIDNYRIAHSLDYGSECQVYLAHNVKNQQAKVAVKLVNLKAIKDLKNLRVRQISLKSAQNQVETMHACDSPYLLKCYQTYENQDFKLLVIEYCDGQSLQSYIQTKKRIPENEAFEIIADLIQGLKMLHENHIVLRDIKADNIISNNGSYKIANFHFSERLLLTHKDQQIKGPCMGSLKLMAPEIIARKPYGLKIDIWSLGILFFQMIYGRYPFVSDSMSQFYQQMLQKDYFSKEEAPYLYNYKASAHAFQFLKRCLSIETKNRSDINEIRNFMRKSSFFEQNLDQLQDDLNNVVYASQKSKSQIIPDQVQEQNSQNLEKIKNQCSIVKYIINQMIKPIKNSKKHISKNRNIVQFLFLLSTRCLVTINAAKILFQENKSLYRKSSCIQEINNEIISLQKQVRNIFNLYSKELTDIENNWKSIIADWFKKNISVENYKKQQFFLEGIQRLEYTKEQQIDFTIKHFKKNVEQQLKSSQLNSIAEKMKTYKQKLLGLKLNRPIHKYEIEASRIYSCDQKSRFFQ